MDFLHILLTIELSYKKLFIVNDNDDRLVQLFLFKTKINLY